MVRTTKSEAYINYSTQHYGAWDKWAETVERIRNLESQLEEEKELLALQREEITRYETLMKENGY